MEIRNQDRPVLAGGQYTDKIGDHQLYYNPLGYGGVTVVDSQSRGLLRLCDGKRTVEEIVRLDKREFKEVKAEIVTLANREVLTVSDQFTRDLHSLFRSKGGISCWLHLTNSCNLACSYCYIHKSPGDMSLETGKLAIDRMLQSCLNHDIYTMNIKFSGGEPLLRFGLLKELVEYSKRVCGDINVTYTILTNAVLVTQEIADYLVNNKIGVGVSLDGVGAVNDVCRYDKQGRGSFERVVAGLEILKVSGKRPSIMTTVSHSNYQHLEELTAFLIDGQYRFRFSLERDSTTGWPELLSHDLMLIEALHRCYDYIEANIPDEDFTSLHTFGDVGFSRPAARSCGAGKNFFAIGHNGELGACGMGLAEPFSTLEAGEDLLDNIRSCNQELATSRASDYPRCIGCVWRRSCAGGCPLQTKATYGRHDRPSPYCEVYRSTLPRVLRIKALQMIRNSK